MTLDNLFEYVIWKLRNRINWVYNKLKTNGEKFCNTYKPCSDRFLNTSLLSWSKTFTNEIISSNFLNSDILDFTILLNICLKYTWRKISLQKYLQQSKKVRSQDKRYKIVIWNLLDHKLYCQWLHDQDNNPKYF